MSKFLAWLRPRPPKVKPPLKAESAEDVEKALVKARLTEIQSRLKSLSAEADVLAGDVRQAAQKL